MLWKRKSKITMGKAVLIEKKILNINDTNAGMGNLHSMKRGTYNVSTAKKTRGKAFSLEFMTESGPITFYVNNTTYYQIDLNSLGLLTRNKDIFKSFELVKIATESDIKKLNWQ